MYLAGLEHMRELELQEELSQWHYANADYVAQDTDELTIAQYSRLRQVCVRDCQTPKEGVFGYSWRYYETADGQRGFVPSCITTHHTSDFHMMFYQAGNAQLHGYEFSVRKYNKKWSRLGMPGIGVEELWMDWGEGGHVIQPQCYSSPWCYAASSKCITCGVAKIEINSAERNGIG